MRRVIYLLCTLCVLILYPAVNASAEDHTVIVLSQSNRTVYDMDPDSGKILKQVQLAGVPTAAVFSWDEQSLFVSVPDQGYISIVNIPTFKETTRFTRPEFKRAAGSTGFADALATTPDYQKLYVSVPGGLEVFDQQLLVLNPDYQQPGKKISLPGTDGQRMLVQGATNKLYYTFQRDNQVAVIDTNTDAVLKSIPVKGGPMDVTFFVGGEAWVTAADGSVSIIDTNKDEVIKTIDTGGKGPGQITIAHDLRYVAATHDDSGTVTILQPKSKEVVRTLTVGKGPLSVAFAPAGVGGRNPYPGYRSSNPLENKYPFTSQLYVTGPSGVSIVNLDKMAVASPMAVGQNDVNALIHYTYPDAFVPPREATDTRVMENDVFTLYDNAMGMYDQSPVHEHRTDMVGVTMAMGGIKEGCWTPACPEQASRALDGGLPYGYGMATGVGTFTGEPHGELHQEEGTTISPRKMMIFMVKNNYYRETNPKMKSDFAGQTGFRLTTDMSRAWMYSLTLVPGKPVHFPKSDYAFAFLTGGQLREIHNGVPEIVHRLYGNWEWDPTDKTVEALSNRVQITVVEFK